MFENRELTVDDYLAILRRRLKIILVPTILAPLVGFGVSYAFKPKYTSQETVLVERQKVPEGVVSPVIDQDIANRVANLYQRALTPEQLRPLANLKLAEGVDDIHERVTINPVPAISIPAAGEDGRRGQVPGFFLQASASNPHDAQALATGLVDIMLQENLTDRAQMAHQTNIFLTHQIEEEKRKLDEMDKKLADFEKQNSGQLPGEAEKNMQMLLTMNSQLDAVTQALSRAQQDKQFTNSMIAQQLSAWKASQNSNGARPETLEKQLADLRAQLRELKTRYTEDYPEVSKLEKDIKDLEQQIAVSNAAAKNTDTLTVNNKDKAELSEPPEIKQLRLQIHQFDQTIAEDTNQQRKLQEQIREYQGRVALSPAVEEQFKQLTRDYQTLQKIYDDDVGKQQAAEKQNAIELQQQGEQMTVLNPANFPQTPSFPKRWLFAGGGLAGGLGLGFGLALWLELRDQCVRTEQDVLAVLGLPVLSQVPWVREEDLDKSHRRQIKAAAKRLPERKKEIVEV